MERASGKKKLIDVRNHSPGRVPWAELSTDTLLEIFKRLPVKDRLRTLPQICKAWRKASFESDCWLFIDMKDWCRDLPFKFNLSPFIAAPVPARTIDRMWIEFPEDSLRSLVTYYREWAMRASSEVAEFVARIWISWNDDGEDDVVDLADEFDEYDSFDFGDEDSEDYFDDEDDMDYG
ncbi:hypothetical protein R1flu_013672 [Riccia fluitans]|uniref:F-box domain-containing protein n=1 Tax=Riccia fluitans TaxID=41844 RepID=A0ABD1YE85_9MARC